MTEKVIRKPIILFLAEGIGLSESNFGNVIKLSKSLALTNLWRNYLHFVVVNKKNKDIEIGQRLKEFLATFNYGKDSAYFENLREKIILQNNLSINPYLVAHFQNVVEHNSTLHLIGGIESKKELVALLQAAKKNKIFDIKIHLLIEKESSTFLKITKELEEIEKVVKKVGLGKISTLSSYVDKNKRSLIEIRDSLLCGKNKKYMTPKQLLAHYKKSGLKEVQISPSGFLGDQKLANISDFDSVIFFDKNPEPVADLIDLFKDNSFTELKPPRFLKTLVFFDFPGRYEEVNYCFKEQTNDSLIKSFTNQKTSFIYSTEREELLRYWLNLNSKSNQQIIADNEELSTDSFKKLLNSFYQNIASSLDDGSDFIFALFSSLVALCSLEKRIFEVSKYYALFDQFLGKLSELVKEREAILIFSSPYGMMEQLSQSISSEGRFRASGNPLPLIIISSDTKKPNSDMLIEALTKSSVDVFFLRKKIIEYFELNKLDGNKLDEDDC